MSKLKFETVSIYVTGANGEQHLYYENNEYKNRTKEDIIEVFKLEPLHYATHLDGLEVGTFKSFNTYNWNAPFTLCGVMSEDIYEGVALVNIHLGGDARGNYSEAYICEEPEALLSQNAYLFIELSNGDTYNFDCDNGEAYFNFDTLDPYYIDFDKELTLEQITELEDKNNN
tara:strand:- start:318 stop:833 length:516 start_codon:yes stop_codon:yes gene_type:complete